MLLPSRLIFATLSLNFRSSSYGLKIRPCSCDRSRARVIRRSIYLLFLVYGLET